MSAEIQIQLQNTLELIGHSESYEELWIKLFSYMSFCDINALTYHHLSSTGALGLEDHHVVKKQFSSAVDDQTDILEFVFDLKLRKGARVMDQPKYWSYSAEAANDLIVENGASPHLSVSNSINAVTIPVHGPGGRNGCFSLSYNEMDEVLFEQKLRLLQWACQNAHLQYCKLYEATSNNYPKLTERETEILTWVAKGKSNSVIAQILGISHHTVNTYLRRCFLKLGTSDRTSLALIGISHGLIEL